MLASIIVFIIIPMTFGYYRFVSRRDFKLERHPRKSHTFLSAKEVAVTNQDNGQTIIIEAGLPLSLAAVRSGMRLSFQCKQGVCKSCTTILDGKEVDTCRTKVPEKAKITLKKKSRLA